MNAIIIGFGILFVIIFAVVAVGIYLVTQSSGSQSGSSPGGSPSGSPAPAPAATDPRQAVWSSGQSIQSDPIDSQTGTAFTKAPSGYSGTPTYTMSLDINIAQTAAHWRNILAHQPADGSGDWGSMNARRPCVYVTGNDAAPPNRIHIVHQAAAADNTNIVTTFAATLGKYFNLTWVVSSGTLKAYVNGVLDTTGTVSAAFTWPTPDQPWTWMHPNYAANKTGAITVANVYFWNSALTDAQVASLVIPSAPTPGVSTTSYFVPEPYSLD